MLPAPVHMDIAQFLPTHGHQFRDLRHGLSHPAPILFPFFLVHLSVRISIDREGVFALARAAARTRTPARLRICRDTLKTTGAHVPRAAWFLALQAMLFSHASLISHGQTDKWPGAPGRQGTTWRAPGLR
ncbi:MAG: hypothetical protein KGL42_16235 [Betaproteobacteria bacterium]|nr:hypothetical protein [Betaproteobacteria bacterium]